MANNIDQELKRIEAQEEQLKAAKQALKLKKRKEEQKNQAKREKIIGKLVLEKANRGATVHQTAVVELLSGLKKPSEKILFDDLIKQYNISGEPDVQENQEDRPNNTDEYAALEANPSNVDNEAA